jgi:peptidoglycan/xylan/chitin deacetylase (PgdA/CDA1 family)
MPFALMYHDVVAAGSENSSGFPGRDAARYKVTPEHFQAHLDAIASSTPPDLPAPLLTFDDGGASANWVADELERYGLFGHFFVTVNYIGTGGFLDERAIRRLAARGHLIGSHSCSHPLRMADCSPARLLSEWASSRAALADILGTDVAVGSVPGGAFEERVGEAAAEAGFRTLFTSEPTRAFRISRGLTLIGRFTLHRWTTPATAAAAAAGSWLPWARQAALWKTKKLGKRVAGKHYLRLRKIILRHGNEVLWGDW